MKKVNRTAVAIAFLPVIMQILTWLVGILIVIAIPVLLPLGILAIIALPKKAK